MKQKHWQKGDHNPQTCLSCRFLELVDELYPDGINKKQARKLIMPKLALVAATLLASLPDKETNRFVSGTKAYRNYFRKRVRRAAAEATIDVPDTTHVTKH